MHELYIEEGKEIMFCSHMRKMQAVVVFSFRSYHFGIYLFSFVQLLCSYFYVPSLFFFFRIACMGFSNACVNACYANWLPAIFGSL